MAIPRPAICGRGPRDIPRGNGRAVRRRPAGDLVGGLRMTQGVRLWGRRKTADIAWRGDAAKSNLAPREFGANMVRGPKNGYVSS